ncbi:MAG: hypothetical protein LUC50_08705 [Ruminococcus sp.]|nr:hypothetical protein [Ruminococcus sp.]
MKKQTAASYYEAKDYQSALATLINAEKIFQDDADYISDCKTLEKEYLKKWIAQQEEKFVFSGR